MVNDHDFLTYCIGKAALYGIYDLFNNDGFVVVGQFMKDEKTSSFLSADTPEFAVEAIPISPKSFSVALFHFGPPICDDVPLFHIIRYIIWEMFHATSKLWGNSVINN